MRVTDGGVNDDCVLLQENEDLETRGQDEERTSEPPQVSRPETSAIRSAIHSGVRDVTWSLS